jgi:hypothetical protein
VPWAVTLNQEAGPNNFHELGTYWEDFGATYLLTGTTLKVQLANNANEYVIADAVRIERVGGLPTPGPEIQVLFGTTNLADGTGTVDFGFTAPSGAWPSKTVNGALLARLGGGTHVADTRYRPRLRPLNVQVAVLEPLPDAAKARSLWYPWPANEL